MEANWFRSTVYAVTALLGIIGYIWLGLAILALIGRASPLAFSGASLLVAMTVANIGLVRADTVKASTTTAGQNTMIVAFLIVALFLAVGIAAGVIAFLLWPLSHSFLQVAGVSVVLLALLGLGIEVPHRISHVSRVVGRDVLTPEAVVLAGFLTLGLLAIGLPALVID